MFHLLYNIKEFYKNLQFQVFFRLSGSKKTETFLLLLSILIVTRRLGDEEIAALIIIAWFIFN